MLEEIIRKAAGDLKAREKARDEAYSRARRARVLSKQAILLLHNGELGKAEGNIGEASVILEEIKEYCKEFTEIGFYEAVEAARQEYAEASILLGLNTGKGYPSPELLGLNYKSYLLGLADVPGELRRQTLDLLRAGDLVAAEENLETMEEIYRHLSKVDEVSLLLKGLRRKLDVARSVTERTRAEITTEASRERLRKQLKKVEDKFVE
jgi:translin